MRHILLLAREISMKKRWTMREVTMLLLPVFALSAYGL